MPKRKLIKNFSELEQVQSRQQRQRQGSTEQNPPLFQLVVSFLKLSKDSETSEEEITKVVEDLLEILQNQGDTETARGLVSTVDVLRLLLPWAVKHITQTPPKQQAQKALQWKVLSVCLESLGTTEASDPSSGMAEVMSNVLPTTSIHKLIPRAMMVASSDLVEVGDAATSCYCILLERFYRPPFDAICDTLLPPLGEAVATKSDKDDEESLRGPRLVQMVHATVKLLQLSLPKANPKKAFHSLLRLHILEALSNLYWSATASTGAAGESLSLQQQSQASIQSFVREGLFSQQHHMDGFRSITNLELPTFSSKQHSEKDAMDIDQSTEKEDPTGAHFRCYQYDFLSFVTQMMQDDKSANESVVSSVLSFVPILLDGFVDATNELCNHEKGGERKRSALAKKMRTLQFHVFAGLTHPMLTHSRATATADLRGVAVQSVGQCLEVLLAKDVYLPSEIDVDDKQFYFLQGMVGTLMNLSSNSVEGTMSQGGNVFSILATVAKLNHLLLHDSLSSFIARTIPGHDTEKQLSSALWDSARDFYCTLISTYRKLRQLDYLCWAFIEAATELRGQKEKKTSLVTLLRLIQDKEVSKAFGNAVEASPIHQVKQILSESNQWIKTEATRFQNGATGSHSHELCVELVVHLLTLVMKSTKLNSSSAQELSPLCDQLNAGAVTALTGEKINLTNCSIPAQLGVRLCSWNIDFKNRCDFWSQSQTNEDDSIDDFAIPSSVASALTEAIEHLSDEPIDKKSLISGGLLTELHLLACYRAQQLHGRLHELKRVAFATNADEMDEAEEAKNVALFALNSLESLPRDSESTELSRWNLLGKTLASWSPYSTDADMISFLLHFFSVCTKSDTDNPAMQLLNDASFFENPNVLSNFGSTGIQFVCYRLQQTLQSYKSCRQYLVSPSENGRKAMDPDAMFSALKALRKDLRRKSITLPHDFVDSLLQVNRCLRILSSAMGPIWKLGDKQGVLFETCLNMCYVGVALSELGEGVNTQALNFVSGLRGIMTQLLIQNQTNTDFPTASSALLTSIFEHTLAMGVDEDISASSQKILLGETCNLFRAMIVCACKTGSLDMFSKNVMTAFPSEGAMGKDFDFAVCASLVAEAVSVLYSDDSKYGKQESFVPSVAGRLIGKAEEFALGGRSCSEVTLVSATCFIASCLRVKGEAKWIEMTRPQLESNVLKGIERGFGNVGNVEGTRLCSVLAAALVSANPSKVMRLDLFSALSKRWNQQSSPLLEASISELVSTMDPEDLNASFDVVLSESEESVITNLRILRLVVLKAKSEEQLEVVSDFSPRILLLALRTMEKLGNEAIVPATMLVEVLVSRKEVFNVRERELALVLASLATAVNPAVATKTMRCSISDEMFDAYSGLLTYLLQRFSKQLYSCVPSVVCSIELVLQYCLQEGLDELTIVARGRQFCRLCELLLPHKDVYKKHVLCIVVEFVNALKRDLDQSRRNSLAPGIYCLLDLLQQHETLQLNSMLDNMGKALLRSVHESYTKVFVYKGQ